MVAYENARLFGRVNELATTDSLTGVANRRHFFELANAAVSASRDTGRPLAALKIDIDHVKRINDAHGHQVGDDVIRGVVARLAATCPPSGLLARYGGEEFVLLLPDAGQDAPDVAERVRSVVAASPVPTRGGPVDVTISLGLAPLRPGDATPDALPARADAGLYRAKRPAATVSSLTTTPGRPSFLRIMAGEPAAQAAGGWVGSPSLSWPTGRLAASRGPSRPAPKPTPRSSTS